MDRERKAFEEFAREVAPYGVKIIRVSWGKEDYPWMEWEWPDGDRGGSWIAQPWAAWKARAALSRAPAEPTELGADDDLYGDAPEVVESAIERAYRAGLIGAECNPAEEARLLRAWLRPLPPPAEPTEAMVEAGARAVYRAIGRVKDLSARELARLCWGAMRADSGGGGVEQAGDGTQPAALSAAQTERVFGSASGEIPESSRPAGESRPETAPTPPLPGSDLLREVEAFLRAIGASEYIDTKDAATARELAGELRALLPTPPAQEGAPDA